MPDKIISFFNSKEPKGKLHTCILLTVIFLIMSAVQLAKYFTVNGSHAWDYIVLSAVNVLIAIVFICIAVHTLKMLRNSESASSENTDKQ